MVVGKQTFYYTHLTDAGVQSLSTKDTNSKYVLFLSFYQ